VTFYNRSQRYLRRQISERGDRCDWFGVHRVLARDAVRVVDPSVEDAPFRWHRGRCDAATYLLQRRLFDGIVRGVVTDPVAIEETVVMLLARVIGGGASLPPDPKGRALVHEAECLLADSFDQPLTLSGIATHADVSVYHLCRTFRQATGLALHQYIQQLRVRHGLERVCETSGPLSRIAVDLGFAHHSHFTSAFRRAFQVTPSQLRASSSRC
jgi:AraC-like DNA-binding protein